MSKKVQDIKDLRAEKEGVMTPQALLESVQRLIDEGKIKTLVMVSVDEDGYIRTGWSNDSSLILHSLYMCGADTIMQIING